jgi:hypothetical protein
VAPAVNDLDPYGIADVYLPWGPEDEFEIFDESEWADAAYEFN